MPCQAAEQLRVRRHAVHVCLDKSKAFLERGELREEPFLSELLFRAFAFPFISSVNCFFHDVLLATKKSSLRSDCSLAIIACRLFHDELDREADAFADTRIAASLDEQCRSERDGPGDVVEVRRSSDDRGVNFGELLFGTAALNSDD